MPVKYNYTTNKNPYSTEYNTYKCASKKLWAYESIVYTNTLEEAIEFYLNRKQITKEEFFKEAVKLRKFDEAAKKVGVKIKDIIEYKDLLKASLK